MVSYLPQIQCYLHPRRLMAAQWCRHKINRWHSADPMLLSFLWHGLDYLAYGVKVFTLAIISSTMPV